MITIELLVITALAVTVFILTAGLVILHARVTRLEDVAHSHELPAGGEQPETVSTPTPAGLSFDALRHEGRRHGAAEVRLLSAAPAPVSARRHVNAGSNS